QLRGERLDGDALRGLALGAQRGDVLVEDTRVVDGLALLTQRVRVRPGRARRGRALLHLHLVGPPARRLVLLFFGLVLVPLFAGEQAGPHAVYALRTPTR